MNEVATEEPDAVDKAETATSFWRRWWRRACGESSPDAAETSRAGTDAADAEAEIPADLSDKELIEWLARRPHGSPSQGFRERVMADIRQRPRHAQKRDTMLGKLVRWIKALFRG